jgi:hypothetical protein
LWLFGIFFGYLVYFVVIWYILWLFGIFCGYSVYFVVIWYILWLLGIFFPVLVGSIKKNLATLSGTSTGRSRTKAKRRDPSHRIAAKAVTEKSRVARWCTFKPKFPI